MKMEVRPGKRRRWWGTDFWWAVGLVGLCVFLQPTSSFCPPLCTCDDSTLLIDCHEARNLKMVPIFLNPQTKFLSFSQNQIKEISMSLQFYSELQLLDFSQNQIESLGGNNFENLRNLKVLNVSYNSIRILESGAFSGLSQAVVLDLSANQIERIDAATFKGLGGLRDLSLDRNRLHSLDWDLFSELQALERLTLRFNSIRILQPPFSYKPFLSTFTTDNSNSHGMMNSRKRWSESEKLLSLTFPTQLNSSSSEGPWTLRNVLELDLSWNELAVVQNFGLAPLISSLRTLNLCFNKIHTVEEHAFSPFPPNSNFPGNNSTTSQVLKVKSGLTSVNLSQNRLSAVPSEALEKLGSSLVELDLSSNRLSDDLGAGAFRTLLQLRRVKVSENPGIVRIDPAAFSDNIQLVTLEANHLPNLTDFPLGLLANKPYLEKVAVQFAQIRTLPPGLFADPVYTAQIDILDLFGNPIDCNCSIWKLHEHVVQEEQGLLEPFASLQEPLRQSEASDNNQDGGKVPMGNVQCYSPPNLKEFKIRDLSRSDFEHCFEPPPFSHDYFELLVILLAVLIVFLIVTAIIIKVCCVYRLCPNQKRQKSLDLDSKTKEGTTLDEFCSNVVLGNGGCESASVSTSCTSDAKLLGNGVCHDFTPPVPPSPALSSRSKVNSGTRSNGSPLYHGGHLPVSYHRSPRTTTLGPRIPVPYDYDDEEERYHQYMTINHRQPPHSNNKLRFNPKRQLVLDNDPEGHRGHGQGQQPPPFLVHYECDYPAPDYRRGHPPQLQRYKQIPSVLV